MSATGVRDDLEPLSHGARRAAGDAWQAWLAGPYRYLLLLSHMRSYSSVLAHVLDASPEIHGSGETQLRYRRPWDVWRLRRELRAATGRPLDGPWLLDKVLHNPVRPLDRWVGADRVRALVFLRRPDQALASIVTLARAEARPGPLTDPQAACDYYVERLHRLRRDGERLGRRALYFDAETLVERPTELLAGIGGWLGLAAPLVPRYRAGRRTGQPGWGDWSPNIRAGAVLDASHSTVRGAALPEASALAEARAAYERTRTALMRHCATLPR